MDRPNRKPPDSAHAELVQIFDLLPPERRSWYFNQLLDEARALDKVVSFEEMFTSPEFFDEASALARQSGITVNEMAYAVHPHQYESFFAKSARCRLDRYLSRSGKVDVRVQVYTAVEFRHRVIPSPFTIHALEGEFKIVRNDVFFTVPESESATLDGADPVTIRAAAGARFVYVDHPLTAWIRQNMPRKETQDVE